jgi:hypothetical protein
MANIVAGQEEVLLDDKAILIRDICFSPARWDPRNRCFLGAESEIVTSQDLLDQIRKSNSVKLTGVNTPNFFKDFIRYLRCNDRWPSELKDLRITARQLYSEGRKGWLFRFARYEPDQTVPFPNEFAWEGISEFRTINTDVLPALVKKGASNRGGYVSNVISSLDIVGSHFERYPPFESGAFLKNVCRIEDGLKGKPELDILFAAEYTLRDRDVTVLIPVEMKGRTENVLGNQIRGQAVRLGSMALNKKAPELFREAEFVVPLVLAPRFLQGSYKLCAWSLAPFTIKTLQQYDQNTAHQMPFRLHGVEALELSPHLAIY